VQESIHQARLELQPHQGGRLFDGRHG
jgi:hypothetical protein